MNLIDIRRVFTQVEDIHHEGGPRAAQPLRRGAIAAVLTNPYAGRYEPGTLNTIGCFGLEAAFRFLNEIGVENIAPVVQSLADRAAAGALTKGYELLAPRTAASSAGIVSMRKPGIDCRLIWRDLKEKRFVTAPRAGWLRVSPHFYISPEEIDAFIEALP